MPSGVFFRAILARLGVLYLSSCSALCSLCSFVVHTRSRPRQNNDALPRPAHAGPPPPIINDDGQEEWYIERIVDAVHLQRRDETWYRVRWQGYERDCDHTWLPRDAIEECAALDQWLAEHPEE